MNWGAPGDRTVAALRFEDLEGRPIAFFVNYALHCCLMFQNNFDGKGGMGISGDVAGRISTWLEEAYPGTVAIWSSGAAGDVDPVLFNAVLYAMCLVLFSAPTAIYSAIYTVFTALFVDRVHQQNITTQVLVVTKLRDLEPFWELGRKMDRGITYWSGHGAYTGDEVQILCICLSKYEIDTLQDVLRRVDPDAFYIVQEGVHAGGNFERHLE